MSKYRWTEGPQRGVLPDEIRTFACRAGRVAPKVVP